MLIICITWGKIPAKNKIMFANVSNPSATNWKKLPGVLVQLSVDDFEGKLAGVNNINNIRLLYSRGTRSRWRRWRRR